MIAICLRCGNTSDNLDSHDEHQLAAGHQRWTKDRKIDRLAHLFAVPCPTCHVPSGIPCITRQGFEYREGAIHVARKFQLKLRRRAEAPGYA